MDDGTVGVDMTPTHERIKMESYHWDSAKEPYGFFQFMMDFKSYVLMHIGGE